MTVCLSLGSLHWKIPVQIELNNRHCLNNIKKFKYSHTLSEYRYPVHFTFKNSFLFECVSTRKNKWQRTWIGGTWSRDVSKLNFNASEYFLLIFFLFTRLVQIYLGSCQHSFSHQFTGITWAHIYHEFTWKFHAHCPILFLPLYWWRSCPGKWLLTKWKEATMVSGAKMLPLTLLTESTPEGETKLFNGSQKLPFIKNCEWCQQKSI